MKTCGIIAEYNPFHKGHIYHLEKAREVSQADGVVVIVSNYFSQRGLPSLLDPYSKAQLALEHGADLVIELPVCYACQSAAYFSKYAIESLSTLGIDTLCFGSETNDLESLYHLVEHNKEIDKDPTRSLNQNQDRELGPNDLLGYHYIQECLTYGITPLSIERNNKYKSATQTRKDFFHGDKQDFQNYFHNRQQWSSYYPALRTILLMSKPEWLSNFFLINEGIEHRLIQAAKKSNDWDSFLKHASSKTYSYNRIMRSCVMILLQIKKEEMAKNDSFKAVKVLGMNKIGREILKQAKCEVYTKLKDCPDFLRDIHLKSLSLYLSVDNKPIHSEVIVYD